MRIPGDGRVRTRGDTEYDSALQMTKKGHIINLRVEMFFEFEKVMQTGILVREAEIDCVVHFLW